MLAERLVNLLITTTSTPRQLVSTGNSFDAWEAKTYDILPLFTLAMSNHSQTDAAFLGLNKLIYPSTIPPVAALVLQGWRGEPQPMSPTCAEKHDYPAPPDTSFFSSTSISH